LQVSSKLISEALKLHRLLESYMKKGDRSHHIKRIIKGEVLPLIRVARTNAKENADTNMQLTIALKKLSRQS